MENERKFKTYAERLAAKTEEYVRENGKLFTAAKEYAYKQSKYVGKFPQSDGTYAEPDRFEKNYNAMDIEEAFIQGSCWKADELMDMVSEWMTKNGYSAETFNNLKRYVGQQQYKNENE